MALGDTLQQKYNDPAGGVPSTIGPQMNDFFWQKKALIEVAKKQYFGQKASVVAMPKNFGKKLKRYHYLPLLHDANINDQGIDANGVTTTRSFTILINIARGDGSTDENIYTTEYAVGEAASDATAKTAAQARAVDILVKKYGIATGAYSAVKASAITAGFEVDDTGVAVPASGNLYGSSKDVGTIQNKLPLLSETGGRVNRVGFRRVEIEGTFENFGFFDEYTRDSLNFDSDPDLRMHINREMIIGANEINEAALQADLLNGAGIVRYGGDAISTASITGEGTTVSVPLYNSLMRLSIELDTNRTPKDTTIITGSRMTDTLTVNSARYAHIGSEMEPTIRKMVDSFGDQAFIPVHKYAAAATVANGEIGSIDQFRFIVVPEMQHWAGAGATATSANKGYRETGGKYDVFPILVLGDEAFTTIGFQTDGKTVKFKIEDKPPGEITRDDPFGVTGLMSIQWYYGTMLLRPERIALIKSVAEW